MSETTPVNSDVPILKLHSVRKIFKVRTGVLQRVTSTIRAVHDVSFDVNKGETLAIVGESGCGKTTTARMVLKLSKPTDGSISFDGGDITNLRRAELKQLRRQIQIVFQDPYSSLNPRMTVGDALNEPLKVHNIARGDEARKLVGEVMAQVGLSPDYARRYPHEFSGGQRQRVGIARALITRPKLIVLDEPVSALDVSIRAGVINLLKDIREQFKLSYLFIAHDLSVVRAIADRVGVMYLGKLVEIGTRDEVFENPQHPYTQALLSSVPVPDPNKEQQRNRIVLQGDVPSAANPPSGCPFRTRCWKAQDICAQVEPPLTTENLPHAVACHFPG